MDPAQASETFLLDTWPIMEWLQQRKPAYSAMEEILEQAAGGAVRLIMCRLNFGEVLYSCWKLDPSNAAQLFADAETLPIEIVSIDDELVIEAARLKAVTTAAFGDCFAAALALRHDVPLVTGDQDFYKLLAVRPALKVNWVGL